MQFMHMKEIQVKRENVCNNHKNYFVLLPCLVEKAKKLFFLSPFVFECLLFKHTCESYCISENESFISFLGCWVSFRSIPCCFVCRMNDEMRKRRKRRKTIKESWWIIFVLWRNRARTCRSRLCAANVASSVRRAKWLSKYFKPVN